MLYIRADGNTEIGMGHVMRCLSIAEAVAEMDGQPKPVFLTADEGCCHLISDRGFQSIVLNTDYRDMMSELPQLAKLLDKENDIILVDSYQVSEEYYMALGQLAKVACLEDMGEPYPVDLLINYNIYGTQLEANYQKQSGDDRESTCHDRHPGQVLLGVEYMPLRKAFQLPSKYVVKDKVTDVTITTGGSDPCFAAGALMDTFLSDSDLSDQKIHWHVISGPFNSFAQQLKSRYQTCDNVTVHENVKDMRSLLLKSDIVLSATGSTIYEVSSLGIPMIVFYFAENQRQGAEALEQMTDIVNAGCFALDAGAVTAKAVAAMKKCVSQKDYRSLLHEQERQLIDGKGALRIARHLLALALAQKQAD